MARGQSRRAITNQQDFCGIELFAPRGHFSDLRGPGVVCPAVYWANGGDIRSDRDTPNKAPITRT